MSSIPDYKETLNLPKTSFAMKANLANRESNMFTKWHEGGLYERILASKEQDNKFILNDGPPYANGDIHIGHALNKILKDIVIKAKWLSGYYAPFIPGWDCHGLPIEIQIEKKFGKAGDKLSKKEFRQKCREYAQKQITIQKESFKKLGIIADWNKPYITMDYKFEADTVRTLAKIVKNKHLVKGDKPVHWCVDCASALADTEVEYMPKTSIQIDVLFAVVDQEELLKLFNYSSELNVNFVIWTTTPWTLPANEAVALNKELTYSLVKDQDKLIVLAKDLIEQTSARYQRPLEHIADLNGDKLENIQLHHPFLNKQVPVILGEHVTLEQGTGAVHTAPAHGYDDFVVSKKYNIPVNNPVDQNGCFFANVDFFAGEHVFKVTDKIIAKLEELDVLLFSSKLEHSYPHCWRHKKPLIFRATQQWFISMEANKLKEKSLQAIKNVTWYPQWGQTRITQMTSNRPDWCISRQRTWGTPLTLVIHAETGELHPDSYELILSAAQEIEKQGIDYWFDNDLATIYPNVDLSEYIKVNDTMDVWFDSGAVYYCVAQQREEIKTTQVDLYLEGSDQHRGWFQTSLLSSVAVQELAPYKEVLTHGFTVDQNGRKMSKSMGNVIAPATVIKTLGADILRLWVAATDYSNDLHVSDEILKRTSDAYRRIRNTLRFLLSNLHEFNYATDKVATDNMLALDQWIVSKTQSLQEQIINLYSQYNFHLIYQKLHNFCSGELGSFYLDIIKDRQYTCKKDGVPRRSAQTAMYYIAHSLVRLLAPILTFTAQEIWEKLPDANSESIYMDKFYTNFPEFTAAKFTDQFWNTIIEVRDQVNKKLEVARNEQVIGSGLEAIVTLHCSTEISKILTALEDELRFVLITSEVNIVPLEENEIINTNTSGLKITIVKSEAQKCARCWHRRVDVNCNSEFPLICNRCVENLTIGENRLYA